MEVRGWLVGSRFPGFSLPACESQGSTSGHQAHWVQMLATNQLDGRVTLSHFGWPGIRLALNLQCLPLKQVTGIPLIASIYAGLEPPM